jgi:hypothetical protein
MGILITQKIKYLNGRQRSKNVVRKAVFTLFVDF